MRSDSITPDQAHAEARHRKFYHCGTLAYTTVGVAILFGWLLWGDFCFTLMDSVVPSILPLKLKDLGSANWLMGLILTTIPGILGITVNPWISVKSDRCRSRWGRRIPFIVFAMPFLCASLALLGWSDDITLWLHHNAAFLRNFAPATITIIPRATLSEITKTIPCSSLNVDLCYLG